MSNFNYPIKTLGVEATLKRVNIVAITRDTYTIDKADIPGYLTKYSNSEIRLGELISTSEEKNIYQLNNSGPTEFDTILFVINNFQLEDLNLSPTTFTSIGSIELPKIGISGVESLQLHISFSVKSPDDFSTEFVDVITGDKLKVRDYSESNLGENGYRSSKELETYFPQIDKSEIQLATSNNLSFIPGGIIYKDKLYMKERLNLDVSNIAVKSWQQISHNNEEYIRIISEEGKSFLRNITQSPTGTLEEETSEFNVFVDQYPGYTILLNPDYIIFKSDSETRKISTASYIAELYTSIADSESESVNVKLRWGTDTYDNEVTTIFSYPGETTWFLQGKYRNIFKNIPALLQDSWDYSVRVHNSMIFILEQYPKNSSILSKLVAVDCEGRIVDSIDDYRLDIDGGLILKTKTGMYIGYRGNLSSGVVLNSPYDLYALYPSATELIWTKQDLSFSNFLMCRDRVQEI